MDHVCLIFVQCFGVNHVQHCKIIMKLKLGTAIEIGDSTIFKISIYNLSVIKKN